MKFKKFNNAEVFIPACLVVPWWHLPLLILRHSAALLSEHTGGFCQKAWLSPQYLPGSAFKLHSAHENLINIGSWWFLVTKIWSVSWHIILWSIPWTTQVRVASPSSRVRDLIFKISFSTQCLKFSSLSWCRIDTLS